MKPLKLKEITGAVNGNLLTGNPDKLINDISTDTRTMKEGDLFIALIGDNFDGHDFVKKAIEKGASGVIIDRKIKISKDIAQILVDNTTRALQDLSRYYRNLFNDIKIIGITGSAGKTTTKDMVAEVLKQKFKILKTEENLNNYIGVPLTLLSLNGDEDFAVIEMGMNQKGEISLLSRIANPEIGIITNVGPAHLKNFETVSDIAREKKQLISNLSPRGTVLLNYDNKYTKKMKKEIKGKKLIFFGLSDKADIYADNIANYSEDLSISFRVKYNRENYNLKLNKPGIHNIYNVLPAIAIARDEGISWEQIEKALDSVELSSLRLEIKEKKGITYINDTYNANPLSMKAALEVLDNIAPKRKIAVLGDMLELGEEGEKAHINIGKYIVKKNIDILITLGELGQKIYEGALNAGMSSEKLYQMINNDKAGKQLLDVIKPGDTVLIKGSRKMKMEEILKNDIGI